MKNKYYLLSSTNNGALTLPVITSDTETAADTNADKLTQNQWKSTLMLIYVQYEHPHTITVHFYRSRTV